MQQERLEPARAIASWPFIRYRACPGCIRWHGIEHTKPRRNTHTHTHTHVLKPPPPPRHFVSLTVQSPHLLLLAMQQRRVHDEEDFPFVKRTPAPVILDDVYWRKHTFLLVVGRWRLVKWFQKFTLNTSQQYTDPLITWYLEIFQPLNVKLRQYFTIL